jgi:hypothetical protein
MINTPGAFAPEHSHINPLLKPSTRTLTYEKRNRTRR